MTALVPVVVAAAFVALLAVTVFRWRAAWTRDEAPLYCMHCGQPITLDEPHACVRVTARSLHLAEQARTLALPDDDGPDAA